MGRGMAGILIGWRTNIESKFGVKCSVEDIGNLLIVRLIHLHEEIRIIPIYLREKVWRAEFEELQNYVSTIGHEKLIVIGDMNTRIGNMQQTY